jgi:hypothetical protein
MVLRAYPRNSVATPPAGQTRPGIAHLNHFTQTTEENTKDTASRENGAAQETMIRLHRHRRSETAPQTRIAEPDFPTGPIVC